MSSEGLCPVIFPIPPTPKKFLTNQGENTLSKRLEKILPLTQGFDCLVGYFFISGFFRLHSSLESVRKVRILIGLKNEQVIHGLIRIAREEAGEDAPSISEIKRTFAGMLRKELVQAEDTLAIETGVRKFIQWIRSGKLEVKLYREQNIRAKVYILTPEHPAESVNHGYPGSVAVDGAGNVFVSETPSHVIRKITPLGAVELFAGSLGVQGTAHGDRYRVLASNAAQANVPSGIGVLTVHSVFSLWRGLEFTTDELLDANISGPNADPDSDGYSNLIEYALGLEPKEVNITGLPSTSVQGADWVYTYTRPSDRTDITYAVECSTNLTSWSTGGVTHELVSSSGGTETWRGKYPLASAGNVFFRLRVTGQ
jgi:hypothetical protein